MESNLRDVRELLTNGITRAEADLKAIARILVEPSGDDSFIVASENVLYAMADGLTPQPRVMIGQSVVQEYTQDQADTVLARCRFSNGHGSIVFMKMSRQDYYRRVSIELTKHIHAATDALESLAARISAD